MEEAHFRYVMLAIMTILSLEISSSAIAESPASSCPAGTILCGGECINIRMDELNCGSCDKICALGKTCINGTCSCLPGQPTCNGTCVYLSIDPANCGSCGSRCPSGLYCINGQCSCPQGAVPCSGRCMYLGFDDQNCGGCKKICPSNMTCINGSCVSIVLSSGVSYQ